MYYTLRILPQCLGDCGQDFGVFESKRVALACMVANIYGARINWERIPIPVSGSQKEIARWILQTRSISDEQVDEIFGKINGMLRENDRFVLEPLEIQTEQSVYDGMIC